MQWEVLPLLSVHKQSYIGGAREFLREGVCIPYTLPENLPNNVKETGGEELKGCERKLGGAAAVWISVVYQKLERLYEKT